jgi:hypothetical protein
MEKRGRTGEAGMGLIELLIYSALLVTVMLAVGGMLISLLTTQRNVVNAADTASASQLVAESLQSGIRNSTAVKLDSIGASDQLLLARSASSESSVSWVCLAWYYSAQTGQVRTFRSSSAIASPTAVDLAGWTLLAQGVSPTFGSGIFSLTGTRLSVAFKHRISNEAASSIQTSVSTRGGPWGSAPCF